MTKNDCSNVNDAGAGLGGGNQKTKSVTQTQQQSSPMTMAMKMKQSLLYYVRTVFGVDVRSLAMCRILLSLTILLDCMGLRLRLFDGLLPFTTNGNIISDFEFFYTENGCLPQHILRDMYGASHPWSLFFVSLTREWTQFCFGLLLLSAITYGVGYQTRVSNIVLWLMVTSLHNRAPLLSNGGDNIFQLLLFWSMFIRSDYVLSMDNYYQHEQELELEQQAGQQTSSTKKKKKKFHFFSTMMTTTPDDGNGDAVTVVSGGTFAFVMQLALIYITSAYHKNHPIWKDGEAVNYVMQLRQFVRFQWIADLILAHEKLWVFLTLSTYHWEFWGPVLLFVAPLCSPKRFCHPNTMRLFVCGMFIFMHTGFHVTMYLGYFPHFCIVYWIGAIPGSFWDKLGWTIDSDRDRVDQNEKNSNHGDMDRHDNGTSINVNNNDNTVRRRKGVANTDADADAPKRPLQEGTTTATMVEGKGKRSVSWLRVLDVTIHHLVPFFLFVAIVIPYLIGGLPDIGPDGHVIVDLKDDSDNAADDSDSPTTTTTRKTRKKNKRNLYAWQEQVAVFLKIDQVWSMYAPYPRKEDGFFLLSGEFDDGKQLDLWNGNYFLSTEPEQPVVWASVEEQQTWNITATSNSSVTHNEATTLSYYLSRYPLKKNGPGISDIQKNIRWSGYGSILWMKDFAALRQPFTEAICYMYNTILLKEGKSKLSKVHLTYMLQVIAGPNLPPKEIQPTFLQAQYCDEYGLIERQTPPSNAEGGEL
mmetsp:Transcript_26345/g.29554  ORF Transcript_26345/g.29554 Transcript_26345/m.29554 type:complete len:753 (+) Transcript_26345:100-2358(+)